MMTAQADTHSASELLACKNIGYAIKERTILNDCSFALERGELVALVGPNGAGKTSVLRALIGAINFSGAIMSGGQRLSSLPAKERAQLIAYLPQNGQIHWPMPVRDIVALGRLSRYDFPAENPADIVEAAMKRCSVEHLAGRNSATLSAGERARVLLARAMATEARVLLADEPLASLDPRHQLDTMRSLQEYAADGNGVMVVMHDIAMSIRFADRILVMDEGRIVASGHGEQLLLDGIFDKVFGITLSPLYDAAGKLAAIATH